MAHDLQGTVQAVTVAFQNRLKTAEIILAFDESHLKNMHLPLRLANGSNGGNGFHSASCVALP
jgi:peptidyl-tRNA hydrolase